MNRILSIVNKLAADGLAKSNYTTFSALGILSNCVLPTKLSAILIENEQTIINQLPDEPKED